MTYWCFMCDRHVVVYNDILPNSLCMWTLPTISSSRIQIKQPYIKLKSRDLFDVCVCIPHLRIRCCTNLWCHFPLHRHFCLSNLWWFGLKWGTKQYWNGIVDKDWFWNVILYMVLNETLHGYRCQKKDCWDAASGGH